MRVKYLEMPRPPSPVRQLTTGERPEDGAPFLRLAVPVRRRECAPCCLEHNWLKEGESFPKPPYQNRPSIHLMPISYGEGKNAPDLRYPALKWFRARISEQEYAEFWAAMDAANLEGTIPFLAFESFPCTFPTWPCHAFCCCLPAQYAMGRRLAGENALNLAVARFNRHLFLPRGMIIRRQREVKEYDGNMVVYDFIRFDLVPPPQHPLAMDRDGTPWRAVDWHLDVHGLRPGTMLTDIPPVARHEWLAHHPDIYPCWQDCNGWCASHRFIGEPKYYYDVADPELEDSALAAHLSTLNPHDRTADTPKGRLQGQGQAQPERYHV